MEQIDIVLTVVFCILFLICETHTESYDSIVNNKPVTLLYPNSTVVIVTMYTVDTEPIATHTIRNLKSYCNYYKFGLHIYFKSPQKTSNDMGTDKFKIILNTLKKKHHKYVIWMESNCFIQINTKKIFDYVQPYKDFDLILCNNINSTEFIPNMMIIKNTYWSHKIIKLVLNKYKNSNNIVNSEYNILSKILKKDGIQSNKINKLHKNVYIYKYVDLFGKKVFLTISDEIQNIININKTINVY